MKVYNFRYLIFSVVFSFLSLLLILVKVFNVFFISDSIFLILLFSFILISFIIIVVVFITFRIYLLDLYQKYNKLVKSLESNVGELIQIEGLEEITNSINNLIIEYKNLRQELEYIKEKEYKLSDLLMEIIKGNLDIKVDSEEFNLVKSLLSEYKRTFELIFDIVREVSLGIYNFQETTYKLIKEYDKFKNLFSDIYKNIKIASDIFTDLSGRLVNFIQDTISNLELLKVLDDISIKILSSASKLEGVSDKIKQNSDDTFKEIDTINNISKRISEISERTLLLSMNAIIESSKAGEYGKGFSVISEEIRKLSESMNKLSKSIIDEMQLLKGKINSNKIFSEDILIESKELYKNAQRIKEISSNSQLKFKSVIDSTEKLSSSLNDISYKFIYISEFSEKLINIYNLMEEDVLYPTRRQVFELSSMTEDTFKLIQKEVFLTSSKVTLNIALSGHVWFINRLLGSIEGITRVYENEIFDHTQCLLGKWYYSENSSIFSNLADFKALEDMHIKFHEISKEILEAEDKHSPTVEQLSVSLMNYMHNIALILKKLIELLPSE
ncbi:MAG: methyl-accepting chemotaxis protein [Brevinematia bacterium]